MEENIVSVLTGILSITGKPGLFKTVSQGGAKLIVESLTDGKRSAAYSANQVISLADVSIYGVDEEKPLVEIFQSIWKLENKAATSVTHKASNDELKEYFEDVFPEYDKERVYPSDIKKVIRWYNILLEKGIVDFDAKEEETVEEEVEATEEA